MLALRPLTAAALSGGDRDRIARSGSRTLTALSALLCRILGLRVRLEGPPPPAGACLVCPNHVSTLDVLVLARGGPAVFVSRGDVAEWPGVGLAARLGGTLFVDRARPRDAARVAGEIGGVLDRGHRVVVFLEGTAGDGTRVLPFRSPLVAPAAARGLPCVAARIDYSAAGTPGADGHRDWAWADDVPFTTHVMRLLRLPRIEARVRFGPARTGADRKALAAALESDVRSMADGPEDAPRASRSA